MRSVVVTGTGIVSSLGNNCQTIYNNFFHKEDYITHVDIKLSDKYTIKYPVHLIDRNIVKSNINALAFKIAKTFTPMTWFAYQATKDALLEANLIAYPKYEKIYPVISYYRKDRIGISIASGLPSIQTFDDIYSAKIQNNPKLLSTARIFQVLNNNTATTLATIFGIGERVISSSVACASGLQSIILGYEAIKNGYVDMMICGGIDEYHPFLTFIFQKLGIASTNCCKPFESNRDGITIGEGAGVVILEAENSARNRGANIICDILGTGMSFSRNPAFSDANSIYSSMIQATNRNRIEYINAIDAHATGTMVGDEEEAEAIRQFIKDYPNTVQKITALKSYLGHIMGACGAIELIMSIYLTKNNKQMVVCTDEELDSKFKDLPIYTKEDSQTDESPFILKNSFGLGGVNTSMLIAIR